MDLGCFPTAHCVKYQHEEPDQNSTLRSQLSSCAAHTGMRRRRGSSEVVRTEELPSPQRTPSSDP